VARVFELDELGAGELVRHAPHLVWRGGDVFRADDHKAGVREPREQVGRIFTQRHPAPCGGDPRWGLVRDLSVSIRHASNIDYFIGRASLVWTGLCFAWSAVITVDREASRQIELYEVDSVG